MKICWDNLEKIRYSKKSGKFYNLKGNLTYEYYDKCDYCGEPFLALKFQKKKKNGNRFCSISCGKMGNRNPNKRKEVVDKSNRSKIKNNSIKKGKNNHAWKGGYNKDNIPLYDTYAHQIEYAEEVRRSPKDENILEVKCTYCGKWYVPRSTEIRHRRNALNGNGTGECRLYCSKECKNECPIYNQVLYPLGYKKVSSREVQPELRQLVFERDNYTCQKCGSIQSLHCHHVEGIRWEPLESCDIDKCITYCKTCHKEVHKIEECGYQDLKCRRLK